MVINWYPGHMAKARRMLLENMKVIDVVVELLDARAPASTCNPDFDELFASRQRFVVLNKADIADEKATKSWIDYYKKRNITALAFVSVNGKRKAILERIEQETKEKVARMKEKGISKTVRAMVVGIPNVGKSTFINCIAGASCAKAGDKPGVTKGKQWVKISPHLELMDTPGLLWPKLEVELYARHLAYIGSIKDDIMDVEELAALLLAELQQICPNDLYNRYKHIACDTPMDELLINVCKSRGFLQKNARYDTQRAARIVLDEFRAGRISRITLDNPQEI